MPAVGAYNISDAQKISKAFSFGQSKPKPTLSLQKSDAVSPVSYMVNAEQMNKISTKSAQIHYSFPKSLKATTSQSTL